MYFTVDFFVWEKGRITHKTEKIEANVSTEIHGKLKDKYGTDFSNIRRIYDY